MSIVEFPAFPPLIEDCTNTIVIWIIPLVSFIDLFLFLFYSFYNYEEIQGSEFYPWI